MKNTIKNFTLAALALCLAVGASAATPVSKKMQTAKPAAREIPATSVKTFKYDNTAKMNAVVSDRKEKAAVQADRKSAPAVVKSAFPKTAFNGNGIRRAPAKAESNLVADELGLTYYQSDGDWYCVLIAGTVVASFDILEASTGLVDGKKYTLADMDPSYTGLTVGSKKSAASAAEFTYSHDGDGLEHVVATMTLSNGDVYNFTYDEMPAPDQPYGEVVYNGYYTKLVDLTASEGLFQFQGVFDDGRQFYLAAYGDQVAGVFEGEDIAMDYTYYEKENGAEGSFREGYMEVTKVADGYSVNATFLSKDYYLYTFNLTKKVLEGNTYNVEAITLKPTVYQSLGDTEYKLSLADGTYFNFDVLTIDIEEGYTYTYDEMSPSYTYGMLADGKVFAEDAEFTYTVVDGHAHVEATMLLANGDTYNITFTDAPLEIEDEVDFVADNLTIDESYSWLGIIMLGASNQEYTADFYLSATSVFGTFTSELEDMSSIIDNATEDEFSVLQAEITISSTETSPYRLEGWVICANRVKYNLDFCFAIPEPTREITAEITGAKLNDYTADNGMFQLMGGSEDGLHAGSVAIYSNSVAGHYTASDVYAYYTFYADIHGGEYTYYDFIDGEFDVTFDGEIAVATGWMITRSSDDPSDCPKVYLTISGSVPEKGVDLEYDTQDSDVNYAFAPESVELITDYSADYRILYIRAQQDSYTSMLEFNCTAGATSIEDGVYEFNYTAQPGTFTASDGVDSEGYITGSFFGVSGAQGIEDVWFIVKGTVTVKNTPSGITAVVKGLNSYGREVNVVFGGVVLPEPNVLFDEATATVLKSNYSGDVVLPEAAQNIAAAAFSMGIRITSITSPAAVPPVCGPSAFYKLNPEMPVYVPAESVDAYKAADGWKMFLNILAL